MSDQTPTKEQTQTYIKAGGAKCIVCPGTNIEGGSVEIDAGGASQSVHCTDCGASWVDEYTLSGVSQFEA